MMNRDVQSSGGAARDIRLNRWEKAFVAMLGGSKRPITKDRKLTPESIVRELRQEGVRTPIPWNAYFTVSMKGKMVPSTLKKPDLVKQVEQMGEIAGFVGIILFNGAWRTYTRRLLLDPLAQERLGAASKFLLDHVKGFEAEELKRREKDAEEALLSAQVYLDPGGKTFSMYYSFHPDHFPEVGSVRVGVVYLLNTKKAHGNYDAGGASWIIRWHSEKPRRAAFAAILKEAERRFERVVRTFQKIQLAEVPKV